MRSKFRLKSFGRFCYKYQMSTTSSHFISKQETNSILIFVIENVWQTLCISVLKFCVIWYSFSCYAAEDTNRCTCNMSVRRFVARFIANIKPHNHAVSKRLSLLAIKSQEFKAITLITRLVKFLPQIRERKSKLFLEFRNDITN